jgi:hypothetical protein
LSRYGLGDKNNNIIEIVNRYVFEILNSCQQLDIITYGKIINCAIKTALFKSRPGSYTSNSIYQFTSNKSYLQARSKLYEQVANVNSSTTPNSSFYLNYKPNTLNCKKIPSNIVNNNHYPVSSRNNTRQKSKNAIIQNQYNITNKYGITSPKDYYNNKLTIASSIISNPLPLVTATLKEKANIYTIYIDDLICIELDAKIDDIICLQNCNNEIYRRVIIRR